MTVFASTSCIHEARLLEKIALMREAGITHIELSQRVVPPGPADSWLDDLRGTRCDLLLHNYFPAPIEPFVLNLASPDDGVRRRSVDLVRTALELSARIGAPFYSVHAGFVNDPYRFGTTHFLFPPLHGAYERARADERFYASLAEALAEARALGVDLLVENNNAPREFPDHVLVRTGHEMRGLLETFPDLGLLLDLGHLRVASGSVGFDPLEAARMVAPHVQAVHLHDNDGTADQHVKARAGGWALDLLTRVPLDGALIISEGRCDSAGELADHIRTLESELGFDEHD